MANIFFWRKRQIKSVWKIEKERRSALLVGTAHFCPYSLSGPLTRLIRQAEIVIFEGPLDEESMARVVSYGKQGADAPSLYDALAPDVRRELNKRLADVLDGHRTTGSYLDLFQPSTPDYLLEMTKDVRPWLAFFTIWSTLLDWKHSMDKEAFHIARKLGKRIEFLETIEDQVQAMDGIPFIRFVNFLNQPDRWEWYKSQYIKAFFSGNMEKFKEVLEVFPTRCASIITNRDPIFFRGIKAAMERGFVAAFVGNAHISGLQQLFEGDGYRIIREQA